MSLSAAAEPGQPLTWSERENILWRVDLPGTGSSSPVVWDGRIYLTGYRGFAERLFRDNAAFRKAEYDPGDMSDLVYFVQCRDWETGTLVWEREIPATAPRQPFRKFLVWHGYASSTPWADETGIYAFFGPEGVFAFDHAGSLRWRRDLGKDLHPFGSAGSPVRRNDLVYVNASIESGTLYALDATSGETVWRAEDILESYARPVFWEDRLILPDRGSLRAFDARGGKLLWKRNAIQDYICPTPVVAQGRIHLIGGRGNTAMAFSPEGDELWRTRRGSNVSSPVFHEGHLYFANEQSGELYALEAASGELVHELRLPADDDDYSPMVYASPVRIGEHFYWLTREHGTFVTTTEPRFEIVGRNVIADDPSIRNATPTFRNERLLLRSGNALYSIGARRGD